LGWNSSLGCPGTVTVPGLRRMVELAMAASLPGYVPTVLVQLLQ
jgi:hypothetical protein